jgi:phage terminase large subunit-like protein
VPDQRSARPCRRDGWPPRLLTPVSTAEVKSGDGPLVAEFIEAYAKITKDTIAGPSGSPLVLRPWQHDLLGALFARRGDGRRKHRVGLIGLPRKNGKSALGSGIALYGLLAEGDGAEVYSCAADREQARIVFGVAKRMVELEPELASECKLYRDAIEVPSTGSVYRVLSSEAFTKEGLSPTLVVYDELHAAPNDELWNVMNLGSGARRDPLVLAITTAGVRSDSSGGDSVCFRMFQHGEKVAAGELEDPAFFMAWWSSAQDADHRDPGVWRMANPGYGDLIDPEDFASAVIRTPEAEYRTKRCNLFVATATTWLPAGTFEARGTGSIPDDGAEVVLGFDGSYSGDSTGLVGCTIDDPTLWVVDAWERPADANPDWRVDIAEVEQSIRVACSRWRVREVSCDPYRWARTIQDLGAEGLPMVEFPQSPARMVPATAKFYDAVTSGGLSHNADPRLERHVRNAQVKVDRQGPRIVKDAKSSPRKIDLAVCAVMAHDRATANATAEAPDPIFFFS